MDMYELCGKLLTVFCRKRPLKNTTVAQKCQLLSYKFGNFHDYGPAWLTVNKQ